MINVVYVTIDKETRAVYITDFAEAKFVMSRCFVYRPRIAGVPNS